MSPFSLFGAMQLKVDYMHAAGWTGIMTRYFVCQSGMSIPYNTTDPFRFLFFHFFISQLPELAL